MQIAKQVITPKRAMEWLKRNINNRPLSNSWVKQLAAAMSAGEWKMNGEAIKFNGNGDLIDGQHRLNACVISGKQFDSYVVNGLDHDAFDTIDQGKRRSTSDMLAREGEKHYTTLASAARNVWALNRGYGDSFKAPFRPSMMREILKEHPAIREAVDYTLSNLRKKQALINPGPCSGLVYLTRLSSREVADVFWPRVLLGEGLSKSMPEYWLRQRLIDNLKSVSRLPREAMVALVIKAWNLAKAGRECKNLKFDAGREEYPKID